MIKLFNEYSGYLDKYYEQLTFEEYLLLKNEGIDISDNIYQKIKKLPFNSKWIVNNVFLGRIQYIRIDSVPIGLVIIIFQLEDDYFLVYDFNNHFFKCDQWEGLVKLLKDIDVI